MGKKSKRQRRTQASSSFNPKARKRDEDSFMEDDSEDEIDAFHKQRDMIPLDVNHARDSEDEDLEEPIFNLEGDVDEDSEDDSKHDDNEDNYEGDDDGGSYVLSQKDVPKLQRTAKYIEQISGGGDYDVDDNEDEDDGKKEILWGRTKNAYYNADNVDYEIQSSDEDSPMEEEVEVKKIQRDKAEFLSMEDFGLEDINEDDSDLDKKEKTLERRKQNLESAIEMSPFESYENIRKDFGALSKKKQMEAVLSSAPELVGLLSELNEALDQLGTTRPVICEVNAGNDQDKGNMSPMEVKRALLLTYCQTISFYLLLKAEGLSVRDHPVIARLVEIKNMIEKMKQIDVKIPPQMEEDIGGDNTAKGVRNTRVDEMIMLDSKSDYTRKLPITDQIEQASEGAEFKNGEPSIQNHHGITTQKDMENQMGLQSLEMLKVRANLEAKLKERGFYGFTQSRSEKIKNVTEANRNLETLDDFDDEVQQNGQVTKPSKHLQTVTAKPKKTMFVSGDDDLPKRDDIGERRRKHELRVLARVEANSTDLDAQEDNASLESEDEFYKDVKRRRAEKLSTKQQIYSVTPVVPSIEENEADGKRQITYQMEKNRGLTRHRNKKDKIPRKKYKKKHAEKVKRRKGQVRDIRKPSGPYGGELSGINANVSRSIRFKS